ISQSPAPPASTGSVNGPLVLQRLPGAGQNTASLPAPRVTTPDVRVPEPSVAVRAPGVATPTVRGLETASPSPFPTDQQIGVRCATAANPSMCELAEESKRNSDPAYRKWKADEDARRERNIDAAMANVDAAIAAKRAQEGRQTIPVAPRPQPYDNSDPDLAKCREGSNAPWTIAGCYDLGRPVPRNTTPANTAPPVPAGAPAPVVNLPSIEFPSSTPVANAPGPATRAPAGDPV